MEKVNFESDKCFTQNTTNIKNKTVDSQFSSYIYYASTNNMEKEVTQKFNINTLAKSLPGDKESIWKQAISCLEGSRLEDDKQVIIAPNILKNMSTDSKARQHVENKIMEHIISTKEIEGLAAISGDKIVSSGIIFKADGTCTSWNVSGPTPEKLKQIEEQEKIKEKNQLKLKLYYQDINKAIEEVKIINKQEDFKNLLGNKFINNQYALKEVSEVQAIYNMLNIHLNRKKQTKN